MSVTLRHPDGLVHINKSKSGKNRLLVEMKDQKNFVKRFARETSYSVELIDKIIDIAGPSWFYEEHSRVEYSKEYIKFALLSYVNENNFTNKTIMDFGCGYGYSTIFLGQLFPTAKIIGVDLVSKHVKIAKILSEFYNFNNIHFFVSPSAYDLPKEIEPVSFILLNAVYEHFLPDEKIILLPKIWYLLKQYGVLFINETPHKYFPIECHTTKLPIINYLPDKMTMCLARKFCKKIQCDEEWKTMLRRGIRGGSIKEVINILSRTSQKPLLLKPKRLGIRDQNEIWYKSANTRESSNIKKCLIRSMERFTRISGLPLSPYLSIAIQKTT